MARTFLAGIVVLALVSSAARTEEPSFLQPKAQPAKGPAPRFFTVTGLDTDQVELTEVSGLKKCKPAFKYLDISDAGGKKLSAQDFTGRVKIGTVVVVAADGNKVDPAYLSVMKDDAVVLGGVIAATEATAASPEDKKDEIKYDMDDLEKNQGVKFKAAKVEQKKAGGAALITMTLQFTKDLPELRIAELGGNGGVRKFLPVRDLFAGKKGQENTILLCYFMDEDGVVIAKQPPGKIDGEVSGKEGDAFRVSQSVPGDVLTKTKKISFREEPFKK